MSSLERATSGELGNNKVFCPVLDECSFKENSKTAQGVSEPPPPVLLSEVCDSGMGRWKRTPLGPYEGVGPTCQHKAVPQHSEKGSPWILEQPTAAMPATQDMSRERGQGRSSVAWAPSGWQPLV